MEGGGGGGWGWRMKSKCVTNQLEITAQFFHLVMFIMRHKMALTLQSVNKIQVRVTIQVKATKYYFQVGPFIMYFKLGGGITRHALKWNHQGKRKKEGPKNTWRRDVQAEMKNWGHTSTTFERLAQNRTRWRKEIVDGPSSRRSKEHN